MQLFEGIAVFFGVLQVIFAIPKWSVSWIVGILCALMYCIIFYSARLYMEAVFQLFFIGTYCHGFRQWKFDEKELQSSTQKEKSIVKHFHTTSHIFWLILILIGSVILGMLLKNLTNASYPFLDSWVTLMSIYATLLQSWKYIDAWICWIVVDTVSIMIYFQKMLYFTASLFVLYIILAGIGFVKWKNETRDQRKIAIH
jgi:nicotinamide mononucleotide transporter